MQPVWYKFAPPFAKTYTTQLFLRQDDLYAATCYDFACQKAPGALQGQATQLRLICCDFCLSISRAQHVCTGIHTDMQVELLDVTWCIYLCIPQASNATLLEG